MVQATELWVAVGCLEEEINVVANYHVKLEREVIEMRKDVQALEDTRRRIGDAVQLRSQDCKTMGTEHA